MPQGVRVAQIEPRLGVPTFVFVDGREAGLSPKARHLDPRQAAQEQLQPLAELYRLNPGRLADLSASVQFGAPGEPVVVQLQNRSLAHPIWRERLSVLLDPELRVVAVSGHLSPHGFTTPAPFRLSGTQAWDQSGNDLALYHDEMPAEARVEATYFSLADRLEPAWVIELGAELRVISAIDGRLLDSHHLGYAHTYGYRVYADARDQDAPADDPSGGSYLPHPSGRYEAISEGATTPSLVYLDFARPGPGDPWLPPQANDLIGNAGAAYVDQAAPDGLDLGDIMPVQNGPSAFDYPHEASQDPRASSFQAAAAATQLFFAANHFHDVWYAAGFTELAGNAQADNFGRGGLEGDRLLLEVETRIDSRLAHIVVPRDGSSPRLETFLVQGPATVTAFGWGAALLAHRYFASPTDFGPTEFQVDGELAVADDGGETPELGCGAYLDPDHYVGKLAVVREGSCAIGEKALYAQAAGALGVLVVPADGSWQPPRYSGSEPAVGIPVVSLIASEGGHLFDALGAGELVGMTLASRPAERRDAALDRTVVDHELGHYLVSRLLGDGVGLSNLQGRALAEGWADYVALLAAVRPDDVLAEDFGGLYPIGGYAAFDRYFGARRVPYSIDTRANPLTFGHVVSGAAWPDGVPHREVGDSQHQAGEVWATVLFEGAVSLFRDRPRLDFETARRRLRSYLVRALSITPVDPTFLEARDALLAVALANDPADYKLLWEAFARRGFGQGAVAPERHASDFDAAIESFQADNAWSLLSAHFEDVPGYCDRDGILDDGESGTLVLVLKNVGPDTLAESELLVESNLSGLRFPNARVPVPATAPWRTVTVRMSAELAGDGDSERAELQLELYDPAMPELLHLSTVVPVNQDPQASTGEDFESLTTPFTAGRNTTLPWVPGWSRVLDEHGDRTFFAATPDRVADQYLVSPPLHVRKGKDLRVTFEHRYALAPNGDGAVVEITTDNGTTWSDLGPALSPGYNGTIDAGPLQGRPAYVGFSGQLPGKELVTASLGTTYGGRTIRVRFRHASDAHLAWWGWEVDNVHFHGIVGAPFVKLMAEDHQCANRPPVAVAPLTKIVPERSIVAFDLGLSRDPDGDPLSFRITQIQGPGCQLNPTSFVAPNVRSDTPVAFQVVAFDGQLSSGPVTFRFLVRNIDPPLKVVPPVQLGRPRLK
ncbi:MAG: M36 family metallopeptidase [Deltaproteobacteria bacterium]|nr:M36 family metallopeptidase [Deltaproteobacteria bacterium]